MNSQNTTFWKGFKHAGEGIMYAFCTQRNFRVHLLVMVGVLGLGAWLNLSPVAWAILALTIGCVLFAEMVNTAIETLVDLASPDYHKLAKHAKDCAAGAVLLMAIMSVIVGLLILGPPLLTRLLGG